MDKHLEKHGLMEAEQRGAKKGCSGTMENLLITKWSHKTVSVVKGT